MTTDEADFRKPGVGWGVLPNPPQYSKHTLLMCRGEATQVIPWLLFSLYRQGKEQECLVECTGSRKISICSYKAQSHRMLRKMCLKIYQQKIPLSKGTNK
jgi:hypothetical protein